MSVSQQSSEPSAYQQSTEPRRYPGRLYVWLGVVLALLGPVLYVVQVAVQHTLTTPWYAPVLATAGLVLVVLALVRARSLWRILDLVWIGMLAAAGWYFVSASRLPPYAGPVTVGRPFPAFTTALADGRSFSQENFKNDKNTVLVFFRGRW